MHALLAVLLVATSVVADQKEDRRTKLPYVADAVGNSLPPPSEVPATVGSPVNLLNPDRYEFYTFDESGELVKRLMTLEEIQAIVAAGEETEGLVTFANENQPTVAFNFTQPSHNKVHSVVTNVQNVLKAQMEAHKKKPIIQPTLDTPDVSDSWSLILPSIFGNSGIDIVPDKNTETFITPETDTIEFDDNQSKENSYLSKQPPQAFKDTNEIPTHTQSYTTATAKPSTKKNFVSTTTPKPVITTTTTTTTSTKTITTTPKYITSSITTTTTTKTPPTTTTKRAFTSKYSTTFRPNLNYLNTRRPTITIPTKYKPAKPNGDGNITSIKVNTNVTENKNNFSNNILLKTPVTNKNYTSQYEKISTYIPISTASYITEKSTVAPVTTAQTTTLSYISSTDIFTKTSSNIPIDSNSKLNNESLVGSQSPLMSTDEEQEKINSTTMTTQSVSPSTTLTSTELTLIKNDQEKNMENDDNTDKTDNKNEPVVPLFDVAQSISQIASDLGGEYNSVQTANNVIDANKISNLPIESKENVEIDIPSDPGTEGDIKNNTDFDNFVRISTLDPQETTKDSMEPIKLSNISENINAITEISPIKRSTTTAQFSSSSTTMSSATNAMDPILSESMGDMLSQVMNENSLNQLTTTKSEDIEEKIVTTQRPIDKTTLRDESFSATNSKFEAEALLKLSLNKTKNKINDKLPSVKNNTLASNTATKDIINEIISLKSPVKPNVNKTENSINKVQNKYQTEKIDNEIKKQSYQNIKNPPIIMSNNNTSSYTDLPKTPNLNSNLNFNTSVVNNNTKSGINNSTVVKEKPLDDFKKKIQKVNIEEKDVATERNNSWKLVPAVPSKLGEVEKDNDIKKETLKLPDNDNDKDIVLDFSQENQGLEVTTKELGEDILQFTDLCNELAFRYWNELIQKMDTKRSFVLSPYSITSMLAMMFMGARGATSGEMNDVLKLDDMVTFNPHFTLKNISDSIVTSSSSGVAISAFIRELYSEKSKGKILTFYKERAQHFYNGHVEEISFKLISDIIRRRTNLLAKRYTWGKIPEYMKTNSISMNPPLAAFSTNIFETDCTGSSVEGRDGEMYFVVSPTVRQRRLVPVPAVVYKSNFLAGYDPVLDATAVALGNTNSIVSTLFLMPGQQGNVVHAEDLEALEKRLLNSAPPIQTWNRLLRTLLPRVGLELQIPRFSHKSIFNVTSTLRKMGLKELFDAHHADLAGINGPSKKELHLSDMIQLTTFATCGEGLIGEQHHIEEYPEGLQLRRRNSRWTTIWDEPRDYQRAFHDPHDVGDAMHLPLHLRPRQARLPTRNTQPPRLKYDRPFLFFVRHNPSGMLLYVGRYNPRLLP